MPFLFFIVIILVPIVVAINIYNGLVARRNRYKNSFAQIDVQLKRRYDLIPNLIETAKGYMAHERQTLESVIKARNDALSASQLAASAPGDGASMQHLNVAEGLLRSSMGKFIAVMEQYPDLKANQTMGQLMEELASTENKIAFARQAFNDFVMDYNTARESFPHVLIAGAFHFSPARFLEATESAEEKNAVKVSFT